MEIDQSKNEESSQEKWVYDSCVDHKGRIPVRASTGAWKASVFIIGKQLLVNLINVSIIRCRTNF